MLRIPFTENDEGSAKAHPIDAIIQLSQLSSITTIDGPKKKKKNCVDVNKQQFEACQKFNFTHTAITLYSSAIKLKYQHINDNL